LTDAHRLPASLVALINDLRILIKLAEKLSPMAEDAGSL